MKHLLRTSTAVAVQHGDPLGKRKTGCSDIQGVVCFRGDRSVGS